MNLYDQLRERAHAWADRAAVHEDGVSLTFGEVYAEAEQLARALTAAGLQSGEGLCIADRNSAAFIIAMLAGLRCGAVVIPMPHGTTPTERAGLLGAMRPHAYLAHDPNGEWIVAGHSFRFEHLRTDHDRIAAHVPDAAFIRSTSGTTGASKGVIIGHRAALERIEAANAGLHLTPDDAVVWVLPMAYHFLVSIMLYLHAGAAIILCHQLAAEEILRAAIRYGGTLLYASPMHIRIIANAPQELAWKPDLRVISTSAKLPEGLAARFHARTGVPVAQALGIIEVGLPIINSDCSSERPDAVGHLLPGYEARIVDEGMRAMPDGGLGQLALRGPGMFDGYLDPPTLRSDHLHEGWFLTGDLATRAADGLITIRGRRKSVINCAGNKVFPEEVEAILDLHPNVAMSRVYGGAHALLGEVVEAEVVPAEGSSIDTDSLIDFCREHLSGHKVPQRITCVDQLRMTPTGKVKRD